MMRLVAACVLVACSSLMIQAQNIQYDDTNNCFGENNRRRVDSNVLDLYKASDNFSLRAYTEITTRGSNNGFNVVMSGYSVWSVLCLAYLGTYGETRRQLGNALGVNDAYDCYNNVNLMKTRLTSLKGVQFSQLDQAAFSDRLPLRQCIQDKIQGVERVNFGNPETARQQINLDVSRATEGKINPFLKAGDLSPRTRFVLLNAVYFNGSWAYPFEITNTRKEQFFDGSKTTPNVDMMSMRGAVNLKYASDDTLGGEIVRLPYKGEDGSDSPVEMIVILPHKTKTADDVLNKLTSESLNVALTATTPHPVDISMPRFKMTTRMASEINQTLYKMGVVDLFRRDLADLRLFVPGDYAQALLHHAVVEVSEKGTVAAAASAIIGTRSGANRLRIVKVNRPFIFIIRDNTDGLTLFTGVLRKIKQLDKF